jgi:hypothetical protein
VSVTGRLLSYSLRFVTVGAAAAYAANLAAILTTQRVATSKVENSRFVTAADTTLRFGTVRDSDVINLLEASRRPWHQSMWRAMSSDIIVDNVDDGFRRVRANKNYALLWHKPGLKFRTLELDAECLTSVAELNAEDTAVLTYGIIVSLNSRRLKLSGKHVIDSMNHVLVQLHQRNFFRTLDAKLVISKIS